jgi:FkbM family methyltransferase
MLIPNALNNLNLKGIIHVGAHELEEQPLYDKLNLKVLWIEANPFIAQKYPKVKNVAISNKEGIFDFVITSNPQSSSLLRLKDHKNVYPNIFEQQIIKVPTTTLDILIGDSNEYDSLNLDIQGGELNALKGAVNLLPKIKAIYSEVNISEMYEGCPFIWDIDSFLSSFGFIRTSTEWDQCKKWGDALYLKK